eukprot:747117-Hanusia_phi.AAC.11
MTEMKAKGGICQNQPEVNIARTQYKCRRRRGGGGGQVVRGHIKGGWRHAEASRSQTFFLFMPRVSRSRDGEGAII